MKIRSLIILLVILLSMIPAYYLNRYLQQVIQPRASFGRLLLYMLAGFAMAFAYTFLMVFIIGKIFPVH